VNGAVLFIPRGLPASGKSTAAREMIAGQPLGSIVRVNRDDIRAMLFGPEYRVPKFDAEKLVSLVEHGPIEGLLRAGTDVIVDDTNLRTRFVKDLMQIAERAGATVKIMDEFLDVPLSECLRRDQQRENPVGDAVIVGMHQKYLSGGRRPMIPELDAVVTGRPYVADPKLAPACIFDLDGTLALHTGVRDPYDTSRYHLDKPNTNIIEAVRGEYRNGNCIIFCSGRDEEFWDATVRWIHENVTSRPGTQNPHIPGAAWNLFMRPQGDRRNDAIVKLELFDQHIRGKYNVLRIYDDRDRVIKMWRELGLTALQVNYGAF
jgi:predicted kinase